MGSGLNKNKTYVANGTGDDIKAKVMMEEFYMKHGSGSLGGGGASSSGEVDGDWSKITPGFVSIEHGKALEFDVDYGKHFYVTVINSKGKTLADEFRVAPGHSVLVNDTGHVRVADNNKIWEDKDNHLFTPLHIDVDFNPL